MLAVGFNPRTVTDELPRRGATCHPSLRDGQFPNQNPGVETPGYHQSVAPRRLGLGAVIYSAECVPHWV